MLEGEDVRASMQLAVAEGPNHCPGCLPQAVAPCWTKRWIEKGARGSSAKRERMEASVGVVVGVEEGVDWWFRRHSRPRWRMVRALARRDWPDRIMQPHPLSLLKPSLSARLRSRTENVMPELAEGSEERGMGGKLDLYVIQIRDSKSSRNGNGQPPSAGSLESDGMFSDDTF